MEQVGADSLHFKTFTGDQLMSGCGRKTGVCFSEKLRQISVELEGKIEFFKLQEDVEAPEGDSAEESVEESPAAAEEETSEE